MEEDPGPSASEPFGCRPPRLKSPDTRPPTPPPRRYPPAPFWLTLLALILPACGPARRGDVLARIKKTGTLVYGSDKEGGGPYIFPDPNAPREVAGFEVELMRSLAG